MTVTRRNILVAAWAGAGGLLLAACSGSAVSGSAPTTAGRLGFWRSRFRRVCGQRRRADARVR